MDTLTDSAFTNAETQPYGHVVHIIGAGPVGLLLAALFQSMQGFSVRLYEKRPEYKRTRMVKLSSYLVADSVESYCNDYIDGENIAAVFDIEELEESLEYRRALPPDLMSLFQSWALGFCPLNAIEQALSNLINERGSGKVQRLSANMSVEEVKSIVRPGEIIIDSTGCKSLLRDNMVPGLASGSKDANTFNIHLENAIVVTFLYGQHYLCNEYCKYYKNAENQHYKFIPAVDRICYDGNISFVSGIVNITAEDFEAMPPSFDGEWLRLHFPDVARSMDRFIDNIKLETHGEIIGNLEVVRIPLNLYRARNVTSRNWLAGEFSDHPFHSSPVFLAGDAALGSPYFQSISLGMECAIHLAGLIGQQGLSLTETFNRYELFVYKQWLRVYMRSKMIKHNKDLFESLDDPLRMLDLLHIY